MGLGLRRRCFFVRVHVHVKTSKIIKNLFFVSNRPISKPSGGGFDNAFCFAGGIHKQTSSWSIRIAGIANRIPSEYNKLNRQQKFYDSKAMNLSFGNISRKDLAVGF